MSDERTTYNAGAVAPATRAAFKNRPCALPFNHVDYAPPTPGEVDALIKLVGWSQTDTAKLVGVTYNPLKGSSTVRKWRAPVASKDHRDMPYSAWRLLLVYAGVVSVDEGLAAIDK